MRARYYRFLILLCFLFSLLNIEVGAKENSYIKLGDTSYENLDSVDVTRITIKKWDVLPGPSYEDLQILDVSKELNEILVLDRSNRRILLIPFGSSKRNPRELTKVEADVIQGFFIADKEIHLEMRRAVLRIDIETQNVVIDEYMPPQIVGSRQAYGLYNATNNSGSDFTFDSKIIQLADKYRELLFQRLNNPKQALIRGPFKELYFTDFAKGETRILDIGLPTENMKLATQYRIQPAKVGQGFTSLIEGKTSPAVSRKTRKQGSLTQMTLQICDLKGYYENVWDSFKDDSGILEQGNKLSGFLHPPIILSTEVAVGLYEWNNKQWPVLISLGYVEPDDYTGNWMLTRHRKTRSREIVNKDGISLTALAKKNSKALNGWIRAVLDSCVKYYENDEIRQKVDADGIDRWELNRDGQILARYRIGDGSDSGHKFMNIIYDYFKHIYPKVYEAIYPIQDE